MKICRVDYELEHTQTFLIRQLAIIIMKNGRHLEFCKMIILIMFSEYRDIPLHLCVKFHENPSNSSRLDFEQSQEQNINNLLIN